MWESRSFPNKFGAGKETRTLDLYLGKVSLYQLSYSRKKRSPHYRDITMDVKYYSSISESNCTNAKPYKMTGSTSST